MQNKDFNKILQNAQRNFICPLCGKQYLQNEIKLRGFFDEVYIFETRCIKTHPLLVSIFIAALSDKTNINTKLKTIFNPKQDFQEIVTDIHKQLDQFDGDFSKLWENIK